MMGWVKRYKGRILILCALCVGILIMLFPGNNDVSATSNRLAGLDRFQTARIIAEQFNADTVQDVILTSGNNFPDTLAASVLAKKLNAPILLADSRVQGSTEAFNYISEHLSKKGMVHIIGSVGVISADFEARLTQMGFPNIERIGGFDRYDTALLIAEKLAVAKNTPVVIASGEVFPDALSISSFAAYKGWPILLAGKDYLAQGIKDCLANEQPAQVYIVGGSGVISETVKSQIQTLVPQAAITRLAGQDRFETNASIVQTFAPNPQNIYCATGLDFADALAGSALASQTGDPIMLIDPNSLAVPVSSVSYLVQLHEQHSDPALVCFGGEVVVPATVLNQIADLLQGKLNQDTALAADLPAVGSSENLVKLLAGMESNGARYGLFTRDDVGRAGGKGAAAPQAEANTANDAKQMQQDVAYSETNLQVQGVDEADIVKTDGEYIYQVISARPNGQSAVVVSRVYPDNELKIVATLQYSAQDFMPRELYVDKKHLVVIGESNPNQVVPMPAETKNKLAADSPVSVMPSCFYQPVTWILVYDLSDKTNLVKQRELKLDGNYLSSRKIDSHLYLVTNKQIDYYRIMHQNEAP
ncbi:MAG: cell wall-binding repeat-containing protein, partial [Desulfitobacteriaceae bacterium]|nr:cell wall-binding repeat-containing protein [Desulfitobacteriaceae bacterium]